METLCMSLLFGGVAAFLLYRYFTSRSQNLPPGPRGLSALLSVLKTFRDGSLHKQAEVWRDQYGELVLCRTAIGDICFLNSARLVREMYASKERELVTNDRPQTFSSGFAFDFNDVIFSDSTMSPDWPKRRRLFHYAIKFYGDGVERFESTVQSELQHLTSRIEARDGEEIDMENLLSYSLLCVISILMTGTCPEPESKNVQTIQQLVPNMSKLFDPTFDGVLTVFPFLRFMPGTRYQQLCKSVRKHIDNVIAVFFTAEKESHTPGCQRGMVDVMLDEQLKGENQWLTDGVAKAIILDLITAGYFTSFSTLKSMFLFLAHNPEVTCRIQKEVDEVIGERPPRVADRSELSYTEAVVMETLRLSSIVPVGVPHQTREHVELGGYTIPKGCKVFANAWRYLHDPEVYTEPDLFRPERFLDDVTGELLPVSHPVRQSFLPFGIGKRSCPGENFARTRVFMYVTTLLQKFDVLRPVVNQLPSPDPNAFKDGLALEPCPYHLIFRPRGMK